ncbi:MAG TPA: AAA family ATPase [Bryobacteraceae bacterium]|nr:AAA family ATPase [Bryobacteraceae bacterium]
MLSALMFGADHALGSQVGQMCALTQDISVFRSLEHYPPAHETMRLLNSFAPHLVFLGLDDESAAAAVEQDIRTILPSTAVLGVYAGSGPAMLDATAGGFPSLRFPCEPDQFRAAVFQALEARSEAKSAPLFAFLPAKAGSGATTTALFTANLLAGLASKKVLLLECDLHAGPISMLYNVRPACSIMDALEDSHRLTDDAWSEMVIRLDSVDVLPSVSRLGVRRVSAWGYQRLLSFVRSRYDVVIADLPEVVNDATEVVVRAAKSVVVVTTPSTPSLYLALRRRYDLEARGVGSGKVKYVVTRKAKNVALPREAGWSIDAEKIAAIPVDPNLWDAPEFRLDSANPETIAEFTKIAEFLSGTTLVPKRAGFRKFWLETWVRGSRTPELYSPAAR